MALPRGIRNNNPLNIRKGNSWKGERAHQTDVQFEQFESLEYGLRAAIKLVRNYINGSVAGGRKCSNIDTLVSRWAPPSENNTQGYIEAVESWAGISRYKRLNPNDRCEICNVIQAMARMETGVVIDMQLIRSAWDLL